MDELDQKMWEALDVDLASGQLQLYAAICARVAREHYKIVIDEQMRQLHSYGVELKDERNLADKLAAELRGHVTAECGLQYDPDTSKVLTAYDEVRKNDRPEWVGKEHGQFYSHTDEESKTTYYRYLAETDKTQMLVGDMWEDLPDARNAKGKLMIEDKLSFDQRVRLEALAQANAHYTMKPASDNQVLQTAKKFELWILSGRTQ